MTAGSSKAHVLYAYELSHLTKSHKVRLVYILKGRAGEKGLIERLKGRFLASACFIIPMEQDSEARQVMDKWHANYSRHKIMLID